MARAGFKRMRRSLCMGVSQAEGAPSRDSAWPSRNSTFWLDTGVFTAYSVAMPERPSLMSDAICNEHREQSQLDKAGHFEDRILEYLQKVGGHPAHYSLYFELKLYGAELLSRLEEAGIVPTAEDPNPFPHELEEKQHEKWWGEHPKEREMFIKNCERREDALRYLFVGAVLGRLLGDELFPEDEGKRA